MFRGDTYQKIWDSIAEDVKIAISPEQKKLLANREKDITSGKVKTKSWEEIKKGLNKRK